MSLVKLMIFKLMRLLKSKVVELLLMILLIMLMFVSHWWLRIGLVRRDISTCCKKCLYRMLLSFYELYLKIEIARLEELHSKINVIDSCNSHKCLNFLLLHLI